MAERVAAPGFDAERPSKSEDEIGCFFLAVLFVSIRFFPGESIRLFLHPGLCRLLHTLAMRYAGAISTAAEPDGACCYTINGMFLEPNKIHSSAHHEVYRYAADEKRFAIKIRTNPLPAGSIYLANRGFQEQSIIQKTVFGVNIPAADFKSMLCTEYIEGMHLPGMLPASQEEELISSVLSASRTMRRMLCPADLTARPELRFETVSQKIASCTQAAGDAKTARLGALIQERWDSETPAEPCTQLCLYDLHRNNLILSRDGWHIIDTDAVVFGTDSFMFSCLLAAGFLLEGYSPQYLLGKMIEVFPEHCERVALEIIIRLYIGISFFSHDNEDDSLFRRYLDSLERFVSFSTGRGNLFSEPFHSFSERLLRA